MSELHIQTPAKLGFLYRPARYKVLWGGRGGTKSTGIADALIVQGYQRPLRILCARETMNSLSESVHQLLEDRIKALGFAGHYNVLKSEIMGANGTSFTFSGLRHNINNIKSAEGIDIVWVEEAATVSKHSWEVLIPTIRKAGSEIWVSFNPELESDDTYRRFIKSPPPDATVLKVSWRDNPWFPDVLQREMEHLRETDPDAYQHVWEGSCVLTLAGAIYARELREADTAGRIARVPYLPGKPVMCSWDLGFGDAVAIWMFQGIGLEWHFIDYLEDRQRPLAYYLKELQKRPYVFGTHYLPWDGAAAELGTGKSIEEQMRAQGCTVQIAKRMLVPDAINAARTMFPLCWFDVDKCADGLSALRHYRYAETKPGGPEKREPLHDWASHGADAYRTAAVGVQQPKLQNQVKARQYQESYSAWS